MLTQTKSPAWSTTTVVLTPAEVLVFAWLWACFLITPLLPISRYLFYAISFAYLFLCSRLYREDGIKFALSSRNLIYWVLASAVAVLVHWPTVTFSLAGDELAHATSAAFVLGGIQKWVNLMPTLPLREAQQSAWYKLDVRHLPVVDVWRSAGIGILAVFFAMIAMGRRLGRTPLFYAGVVAVLGLAKILFRPQVEVHPPLRLIPFFITHLLFGLNSFGFRIAGLLCLTAVLLVAWNRLSAARPDRSAKAELGVILASVAFIPQVFYTSEAVEANIFAFLVWILVFIFSRQLFFPVKSVERDLSWLSVLLGVGVLFRQTLVVLWLWIFFLAFLNRRSLSARAWLKIVLPMFLSVPYFLTVAHLGHPAASHQNPIDLLRYSLTSGVGVMSVLSSTTVPWVLFSVVFGLAGFLTSRKRTNYFFLVMFVPAFLFYQMATPLLGVGRYQAEYVAPFVAAILVNLTDSRLTVLSELAVPFLLFLACVSVELNQNLASDINYSSIADMRLTTSANFPYETALAELKRLEVDGDFLHLEGSPTYSDMMLWLSGHSYSESRRWGEHRKRFEELLKAKGTAFASADLLGFLNEDGIRYVVVATGTRRESLHRSPVVKQLIAFVESDQRFLLQGRYGPEQGGFVELFRFKRNQTSSLPEMSVNANSCKIPLKPGSNSGGT